jgi:putative membrane protein
MLPAGFLGTRGDILMDLVVLSFFLILPALVFSWRRVRQHQYALHRKTQLILGITLGITVLLFEVDLKVSGGIFELTRDSAYAGTTLLNLLIYSHTLVAIVTTFIWILLIIFSLKRFDNPPTPNAFSGKHRFWGRTGMITMILTGISSFPLYYYGFVL